MNDKAKVGQKRRADEDSDSHVAAGVNSSKKAKKDHQIGPTTKAATNSKANASSKAPQSSSGRTSSEDTPFINAKRPKVAASRMAGDLKASKPVSSATTTQSKAKSSQESETSKKGPQKRTSDSLNGDANGVQSPPAAKRTKKEIPLQTVSSASSIVGLQADLPDDKGQRQRHKPETKPRLRCRRKSKIDLKTSVSLTPQGKGSDSSKATVNACHQWFTASDSEQEQRAGLHSEDV